MSLSCRSKALGQPRRSRTAVKNRAAAAGARAHAVIRLKTDQQQRRLRLVFQALTQCGLLARSSSQCQRLGAQPLDRVQRAVRGFNVHKRALWGSTRRLRSTGF